MASVWLQELPEQCFNALNCLMESASLAIPVCRVPTRLQGYYLTQRWVSGGGMLGISICQPQRCGLYHWGSLLLRDPLQFNLGPHGTESSCVAMRGGVYRQNTCTPQFLVSAPVKRPSQAVAESSRSSMQHAACT